MTERIGPVDRPRIVAPEVERDLRAFSGLLDLAEQVSARREAIRRQAFLAIGGSVFIVLSAAAAIGSNLGSWEADGIIDSPLFFVYASVIAAGYLGGAFLYFQAKRQLRRETKAFEEVMSVVHEVFASSQIHMSPLEIAQVKIRLSRIDN